MNWVEIAGFGLIALVVIAVAIAIKLVMVAAGFIALALDSFGRCPECNSSTSTVGCDLCDSMSEW